MPKLRESHWRLCKTVKDELFMSIGYIRDFESGFLVEDVTSKTGQIAT